MLDQIGFMVANKNKAQAFYTAALAPLGIDAVAEFGNWQGYGRQGKPEFWIGSQKGTAYQGHMHLAFLAGTRSEVERFYSAALSAGGRDHGAPLLRPNYHADYFSALVKDPDGHVIEAVCHMPA
ncbi:VOC family protein [Pseudochrobactrum sp. MP213Fo]|uniref:VOC family protein n=1 Tax=Pseudochrobactrum sp. MP213Fo TaxID=3022250 RepID=UPI003BA0B136